MQTRAVFARVYASSDSVATEGFQIRLRGSLTDNLRNVDWLSEACHLQ